MIQPIAHSLKLYELLTIPRKKHLAKIRSFFSQMTGKHELVMTYKGRDAIYLALKDMGLGKADEVILPGYTCSIVREAVAAVAKPIFIDIDLDTLNMDLKQLEAAITGKTRCIVVVHAYGNPVDMTVMTRLAKKHKLKIIEDCAQAMGAIFDDRCVGSFGDYATFSFGFSKDLTTFKGGILLSNRKIAKSLTQDMGRESSFAAFIENLSVFCGMSFIESMPLFIRDIFTRILVKPYVKGNQEIFHHTHLKPSYYTISLISKQLNKLDAILAKRRANAVFYDAYFKTLNLKLAKACRSSEQTYFRYNLLVKDRNKIIDLFLKEGIRLGALYDFFIAPEGMCLNSELLSEQIINIPVHQDLSRKAIKKIAKLTKLLIAKKE